MADNNDIGDDAHRFDTGDSSDTASNGDDLDSGGGAGLENTTLLVLSLMVLVVAAVPI